MKRDALPADYPPSAIRYPLLAYVHRLRRHHDHHGLRSSGDLFCQQSSKKGEIVDAISAYLVFWRLLTETGMD
jgi:hypothetical protein